MVMIVMMMSLLSVLMIMMIVLMVAKVLGGVSGGGDDAGNSSSDYDEGTILFNDALNTFYLRLYGVGHMVNDHSDSERVNLLPPLFPIGSKVSFICTTPQTG